MVMIEDNGPTRYEPCGSNRHNLVGSRWDVKCTGCGRKWDMPNIAAMIEEVNSCPADTPTPEPVREATSRECGAPAMRAGINEDETCCNLCEDCIGPWAMAQSRYSEVRIVDISTAKTQAWCEAKKRPVDPTPAPVTEQGEGRCGECGHPLSEHDGRRGQCKVYQDGWPCQCHGFEPIAAQPPAPSAAEPISREPSFLSSGPALTDEEIEEIDTLTICGCADDDPDGCIEHRERERCPRPELDDIGAARLAEYYPKIVATLLPVRRAAIRAAKQEAEL